MEWNHHIRSKSEGEENEVEEIFLNQSNEEHERFRQENLDILEDEYFIQDTPLGSYKLKKTKRATYDTKEEVSTKERRTLKYPLRTCRGQSQAKNALPTRQRSGDWTRRSPVDGMT